MMKLKMTEHLIKSLKMEEYDKRKSMIKVLLIFKKLIYLIFLKHLKKKFK